jgi:hypothetical protein
MISKYCLAKYHTVPNGGGHRLSNSLPHSVQQDSERQSAPEHRTCTAEEQIVMFVVHCWGDIEETIRASSGISDIAVSYRSPRTMHRLCKYWLHSGTRFLLA